MYQSNLVHHNKYPDFTYNIRVYIYVQKDKKKKLVYKNYTVNSCSVLLIPVFSKKNTF